MKPSVKRIISIVLALSVLAALILSLSMLDRQNDRGTSHVLRELNEGWYRFENGEFIPVTIPGTIRTDDGQDLALYYDGLGRDDGNRTLSTRGALYRMRVYLGMRNLYTYDDCAFRRNNQMRSKLNCEAVLPEDPSGDHLVLVFENPGDGVFNINSIYLGKSSDVMLYQHSPDFLVFLIVFIMCVIGAICTGAYFYLISIDMKDSRLGNVAWFLLLCGLWFVLDSSLMQKLSNQSPAVCLLSFYAFMTMEIPMLYFVQNTDSMGRYKRLDWCILSCI